MGNLKSKMGKLSSKITLSFCAIITFTLGMLNICGVGNLANVKGDVDVEVVHRESNDNADNTTDTLTSNTNTNINVASPRASYNVNFYDNTTLLATGIVDNNNHPSYNGTLPSKDNFEFIGWSLNAPDNTKKNYYLGAFDTYSSNGDGTNTITYQTINISSNDILDTMFLVDWDNNYKRLLFKKPSCVPDISVTTDYFTINNSLYVRDNPYRAGTPNYTIGVEETGIVIKLLDLSLEEAKDFLKENPFVISYKVADSYVTTKQYVDDDSVVLLSYNDLITCLDNYKVTTDTNFYACYSPTSEDWTVVYNSNGTVKTEYRNLKYYYVPASVPLVASMFQGFTNVETIQFEQRESGLNSTPKDHMFDGCTNLKTIGDRANVIDLSMLGATAHYMFSGCSSIVEVDLGNFENGTINFGMNAFYGCTSLTSIKGSAGVNIGVGENTFYGCTSLRNWSFASATMTLVTHNAFYNCSSLEMIDLSGCVLIGNKAFFGCSSLSYVGDTSSLMGMGVQAFEGCSSLVSFNLDSINTNDISSLIGVKPGVIPTRAFYGCSSLSSLRGTSTVIEISDEAFYGCSNLKTFDFSRTTTIGDSAFWGCVSLSSPMYGNELKFDNLTIIGESAFFNCFCYDGNRITLPKVQSIGVNAFGACKGLYGVSVTDTLTTIGDRAFSYCENLNSMDLSHVTSMGSAAFENTNIFEADLSSLEVLPEYLFYDCVNIGEIILNPNVTVIPQSFCDVMASLAIDYQNGTWSRSLRINLNNIEIIENQALRCFSDIRNSDQDTSSNILYLPKIKQLGKHAFNNCGIEEYRFGPNLSKIGSSTFVANTKLKKVSFDNASTLTSMDGYAFSYCRSLEEFPFNELVNVVKIPSGAFENTSIKNVDLRNCKNMTSIGSDAFSRCNLDKVYLPESIVTLELNVFNNASIKELHVGKYSVEMLGGSTNLQCESIVFDDGTLTPEELIEFGMDYKATYLSMLSFNNPGLQFVDITKDIVAFERFNNRQKELVFNDSTPVNFIIRGSKAKGERTDLFRMWGENGFTIASGNKAILWVPAEDYDEYVTAVAGLAGYEVRRYPIIIDYINPNGEKTDDTIIEEPWDDALVIEKPTDPVYIGDNKENWQFAGWYTSSEFDTPFEFNIDYTLAANNVNRTAYALYRPLSQVIDWQSVFVTVTQGDGVKITGVKEEWKGLNEIIVPNFAYDELGNLKPVVEIGEFAFSISMGLRKIDFSQALQLRTIGYMPINMVSSDTLEEIVFGEQGEPITISGSLCATNIVLEELYIPKRIDIADIADFLSGFTKLSNLVIADEHPTYACIDGKFVTNTTKDALLYIVNNAPSTLVIPDSITSLEGISLHESSTLISIDLNNVVSSTSGKVRLPDTLTMATLGESYVGNEDNRLFYYCDYLSTLTIQGCIADGTRSIVPIISEYTFSSEIIDNPKSLSVYVPAKDVDIYKAHAEWGKYNIVGYGEAGISFYNITIDNNGGEGLTNLVVEKNSPAVLDVTPTREGYSLVGWQIVSIDDVVQETPAPFSWGEVIEHNYTVKAVWEVKEYHIIYTLNGGTTTDATQNEDIVDFVYTINHFGVDKNSVIVPIKASREGYNFIGWYTDEDFQSKVVNAITYQDYLRATAVPDPSINLYARWERITFEITVPDEEDDGFKITVPAGFTNPTPFGDTFRFTIVFEDGYDQNSSENVVVTASSASGTTTTLSVIVVNGVEYYEIPNITELYSVTVTGVRLNRYNVYFRPNLHFSNPNTTGQDRDPNILSELIINNMPETIVVEHGSNVNAVLNGASLSTPTTTGFRFVSWNLVRLVNGQEDISSLSYNFSQAIFGDTIIAAMWNVEQYTLTLDLNGGNIGGNTDPLMISHTIENTTVLPTINRYGFNRLGYTFLGWKEVIDDVESEEYIESVSKGDYGAKFFIAKWDIRQFTITYHLGEGAIEGDYPKVYTVEDPDIILPKAYKKGHTFLGWSRDSINPQAIIERIVQGSTEDFVLYANWSVDSYTIDYRLNGNSIAPVSVNDIVYNNNEYQESYTFSDTAVFTLPTANQIKREGFTFGGWYDNAEFEGNRYLEIPSGITGNKKFYAKWNATEYTFMLSASGGTVKDVPTYTWTFTYQDLAAAGGELVVFAPDAGSYTGHNFIGWYDNNGKYWDIINATNLVDIPTDAPFTLTARWSTQEYKLVVLGNDDDIVTLMSAYGEINTNYGGMIKFRTIFNDERYNKSNLKLSYTTYTIRNNDPNDNDLASKTDSDYITLTKDADGYYIIDNVAGNIAIKIEGFTLNTYTINFNRVLDDDVVPALENIEHGATATKPSDPQKAGYTFIGWYVDALYTSAFDWNTSITTDIELFAKWEPVVYTITILNNVNSSSSTTTYTIIQEKTLNAPSAIIGYEFVGYYRDLNDEGSLLTSTAGLMGDLTIYAKYNLVSYEIHYATFGGTHSNVSNYTITSADITLTPASKAGYDFIGWVKSGTDEIVTVIPQGSYGDIYLEAKFDLISGQFYGVRYYWEDKYLGELAVRKDNPVLGESLLADIEEEGYIFEGWYASADFTGEKYTADSIVSADTTLYAKMTAVEYSITYHSPVIVELPSKVTYTILDTFVVENVSVNGYAFLGWYTGVVESGDNWNWDNATKVDQITKQTGNIDLYARFSPYTYTITYMLDGGNATNPETYTVETSSFALQNASKKGYTFDGWYNGNERVTSIERGSYGNITLTARYTVDTYTISYTNNLDKELAENNPTTYTIEDTFMLTHEEVKGYTFDGWYNGEEKVEIITGRIGNLTLVARYTIETYTISYYTSNGTHTNPSTYTIESGEIVLTPATKENYVFLYWTNFEGEEITSIKGGSTGDLTLIAVYELAVENRYEVNFYDGDRVVYQESVVAGEKLTNYPVIEKEGYTFVDYYVDKDFTQVFDTDQDITSNKTVYLRYDLETYKITYVSDTLGFTHTNKTTYSVVDQVTFGKPNTLNGYTFVGWTIENNPVTSTKGLTGDITVKAVFALNEYKITYVLNGGVANNPTRYTVEDRDIMLSPATKEGYTFLHYEDENGVVYTTVRTNVARDLVLVAVYELDAVEYTEVTYYALGKVYKTEIVEKGHRLTNYSPDNELGYTFNGWYVDDTLTTLWDFDTQVTEDRITLYARYDEITYTITYLNVDEDSSLEKTYTIGNLVTFPDTLTKKGYTFDGFYINGNKVFSTFGYTGNLIVEARFSIIRYNIIYDRNGGNHTNPSSYTILDSITLTDATKVGYTFTGWEDEDGNKVTTIAQGTTGNIRLIATYTVNTYTITYTYTGITNVEITNNNPSQATYEDRITLNNPSVKGYKFIGWYQNNQRVTNLEHILSDISLEGRWEKEKYTITLLPEGSQPENIEYTITDEISLPEQSKKGYEFKGWRDVVTGEIYTTISGREARNITLIPTWELIPEETKDNTVLWIVLIVLGSMSVVAAVVGGIQLNSRAKQKRRRQKNAKELIESLDKLKETNKQQRDSDEHTDTDKKDDTK